MNPDQKDIDRVGLCILCKHARMIRSDRGSIFYQCRRAASDPRFGQYPRLPVRQCVGYEPEAAPPAQEP